VFFYKIKAVNLYSFAIGSNKLLFFSFNKYGNLINNNLDKRINQHKCPQPQSNLLYIHTKLSDILVDKYSPMSRVINEASGSSSTSAKSSTTTKISTTPTTTTKRTTKMTTTTTTTKTTDRPLFELSNLFLARNQIKSGGFGHKMTRKMKLMTSSFKPKLMMRTLAKTSRKNATSDSRRNNYLRYKRLKHSNPNNNNNSFKPRKIDKTHFLK
jgi:hypothetical protein